MSNLKITIFLSDMQWHWQLEDSDEIYASNFTDDYYLSCVAALAAFDRLRDGEV